MEPIYFLPKATVLMDSPRTGITATEPVAAEIGYNAVVKWAPALQDGKFAANTTYTAEITLSPATGEYAFTEGILDFGSVTLKRTSLNHGAEAWLDQPILNPDGTVVFDAHYPATSSEVKIVAKLTDGEKVDDTTNSLTLYEGLHCQWMRVEAHLETDGKTVADRPIQYEWSCAQQQEGELYYKYIEMSSSLEWDYIVPANDIEVGKYDYICKVTADGCEPVEVKYTVTVKDSTGVNLGFNKVYLQNFGKNGLVLDYSEQPDPENPGSYKTTTLSPWRLRVTFTFQREDGTEATHVYTGAWLNHNFDLMQVFYNPVYVDGWYPTADTAYADRTEPIGRMEKTTITNIRLEAVKKVESEENKWEDTVYAGPRDYKCNIKFLPQATQMKADMESSMVYDPTTDTLTFYNLGNQKSNSYYARTFGSFIIDGWRTLCWNIPNSTSGASYSFPVSSINSNSLQEKLRNGESVTAEARTIATYVGGWAGTSPDGMDVGDAEIYVEYVEDLQSVVIDSAGI